MKLTKQDIAEFKAIHLAEYGEELSDAEAAKNAKSMLKLMKFLLIKHKNHKPP